MTDRSSVLFAGERETPTTKNNMSEQVQVESPFKILLNEIRHAADASADPKRMAGQAQKS
jgi:hypothetical protein